MQIKTPNGILEGDTIPEIIKKHGKDCLQGASLYHADLHGADLRYADLHGADLHGADLSRADLRDADLRYADLSRVSLYHADLRDASLYHADLQDANLQDADLRDADLRDADLSRVSLYHADLSRANLYHANLSRADLRDADLSDADLSRANLSRANLYHANLRDADLSDARNIPPIVTTQTSILPDEGDVIGWKKAVDEDLNPVIVKLLIPADAQRSNATGRKCRASKTKVLDIQNLDGESLDGITVHSTYDTSFTYRKGKTVEVDNFDTDRWNECATGIHFYITRLEAVNY